jgi:DNA-directed RNA polymerase subunit RPC12/RpoP
MKPKWLRQYLSCPECGFIVKEDLERLGGDDNHFDCSKCKAHFSNQDFWTENIEKWDRTYKIDEN